MTIRYIFFLSLILFCNGIYAQVDYTKFIGVAPLSCVRIDSAMVINSQRLLDSLNQFEITKGRYEFFYKLGMTYYLRYGIWGDPKDLDTSIKYQEIGFSEFKTSDFAWNLAGNYARMKNCSKSLVFVNLYIELRTKEKLPIDYEQIYYISKFCWKD